MTVGVRTLPCLRNRILTHSNIKHNKSKLVRHHIGQELNYIELFSGVGNVFTAVRKAKYMGAASDLEYGKAFGFGTESTSTNFKTNPFNILDPSGFASLPQLH